MAIAEPSVDKNQNVAEQQEDPGLIAEVPSNTKRGKLYQIRRSQDRRLLCTCLGFRFSGGCSHLRKFVDSLSDEERGQMAEEITKVQPAKTGGGAFSTRNGYDPFTLSSAIQKAVRRGDEVRAMYYTFEMALTDPGKFTWVLNRLRCIAYEDVGLADPAAVTFVAASIPECREAHAKKRDGGDWDLILGAIVMALCRARKSHDVVHLVGTVVTELNKGSRCIPTIPDYCYDKHTRKGKEMGRGTAHFIEEGFVLSNDDPSPYRADWEDLCLNGYVDQAESALKPEYWLPEAEREPKKGEKSKSEDQLF